MIGYSNFSKNLKKLRINLNLSKDELAYELGLSIATLEMYENLEAYPDEMTIKKIAEFFNCSKNELCIS
ncbi:helix-turn-helix domain-containing protein [Clostridium ihumii]|uniref:helix-turn-helix domain-containing protein n=1 Tax=Clostridium ihumii TaxID=1470356 RepID=UPI00068771D4|nr:helix-turn-helix transcriptional regulator [Clostridium ihumii]